MNSIDRKDLKYFATSSITDIFSYFNSDEKGLDENRVKENQEKFGKNNLNKTNSDSYSEYFKRAFLNPFSIILFCLGLISLVTEIFFSYYRQRNIFSLFIIFTMLLLSGISRMAQEMVSKKRADSLVRNAQKKVTVLRNGKWTDIDASELSAGDIVKLSMGDKAFADIRIINSNDLNVSQSVITGESLIIEKNADTLKEEPENLNGYKNIIFSSTTITSGNATGVVVATGNSTVYGTYDVYDNDRRRRFDKGANSIALVLIRYMIIIVPIVFIASGISQSDWSDAFIFAVSIAVGLTPELLPLVVNACLAKGSYSMNHKQTIVKNINAMQGFGSMNVLCVDKTGTLTGDTVILEYYMDVLGNECR